MNALNTWGGWDDVRCKYWYVSVGFRKTFMSKLPVGNDYTFKDYHSPCEQYFVLTRFVSLYGSMSYGPECDLGSGLISQAG